VPPRRKTVLVRQSRDWVESFFNGRVPHPVFDGCWWMPIESFPLYKESKTSDQRIPFPARGELLPRTLYDERERDHALANGPYSPTNSPYAGGKAYKYRSKFHSGNGCTLEWEISYRLAAASGRDHILLGMWNSKIPCFRFRLIVNQSLCIFRRTCLYPYSSCCGTSLYPYSPVRRREAKRLLRSGIMK